jgi:ABC-type transport system involved in Fe-S cluster assembly, permease component
VYRLEEFVETHPDLAKDYVWRLVPPDQDKYTAAAALRGTGGYVIRIKPGAKVKEPILACLSIVRGGLQAPHNVVIAEEGSEAVVYTGCIIAPEAAGLHIGISEFYVKPKAKLTFIMVHSWNKAAHVRPRTGVLVEEEAQYVEYYANLAAVKTLQTSPHITLRQDAKAHAASIVLATGDAQIDIGTTATLEGPGSAAELATRTLATGRAAVVMRAVLQARAPSKGHVECSGLLLSPHASVTTIPQLAAHHQDAALTHEASIGRLAQEELDYLQAKGLTPQEATSLLVKGFITTNIHKHLPPQTRQYVQQIEKLIIEKAL